MNDEATDIMAYLAKIYFDNRCFVTHEKFRRRGFVIHHLWYIDHDVRRERENFERLVIAVRLSKKTKRKSNKRSYRRYK